MGLPAVPLGAPSAPGYQRRRPETTTLYAVVRDNVETLYAAAAAGFEGAALPTFVRREFERYLDCGLLCRGFARMKCDACVEQHLVAFSCKGRGFCPSCLGRRMCQTAANLLEHVLPPVLRQWVLTLPFELRGRLGFDGKLLGVVARIFTDSVLGWYRRRLRSSTHECAEGGAVAIVQRASSDLKLNPHLHVVFLDGVYTTTEGGLVFRALPIFRPPTWPMSCRSPAPASSATSSAAASSASITRPSRSTTSSPNAARRSPSSPAPLSRFVGNSFPSIRWRGRRSGSGISRAPLAA